MILGYKDKRTEAFARGVFVRTFQVLIDRRGNVWKSWMPQRVWLS